MAAISNVNAPINATGRTKLFSAASTGNLDEVDHLLKLGADPNKARNTGSTPLYMASQNRHLPVVERLLADPRTDVNKKRHDGATPLYIASEMGNADIVKRLLAVDGIDVTQRMDGLEPLHVASQNGHFQVVDQLLTSPRIDVNSTDNDHSTALHHASLDGHSRVVEKLLSVEGIDVNKSDHNGYTPLHMTAYLGHFPIVERLLLHPDIDITIKSNSGKLAIDLARDQGHISIIELLESFAHPYVGPNSLNLTYNSKNIPSAFDYIMMEKEIINKIDSNHIIFRSGSEFFYYKKEDINLNDQSDWALECNREVKLTDELLRREHVIEDKIYYILRASGIYLIPLVQMRAALQNKETHIFELIQSGVLKYTADYNAVIVRDPYIGYNGKVKDREYLVSVKHCQGDSTRSVFRLQPLRIASAGAAAAIIPAVGGAGAGHVGGVRKSRRRRRHMRYSRRRITRYRRVN